MTSALCSATPRHRGREGCCSPPRVRSGRAGSSSGWSHLEVLASELSEEHPPYAELKGSDVCVLASAIHGNDEWAEGALTRPRSMLTGPSSAGQRPPALL